MSEELCNVQKENHSRIVKRSEKGVVYGQNGKKGKNFQDNLVL